MLVNTALEERDQKQLRLLHRCAKHPEEGRLYKIYVYKHGKTGWWGDTNDKNYFECDDKDEMFNDVMKFYLPKRVSTDEQLDVVESFMQPDFA